MHIVNGCGHFWESRFLQETMHCKSKRSWVLPHAHLTASPHFLILSTYAYTFANMYWHIYIFLVLYPKKGICDLGNEIKKEKSSSYSFGHEKEPHSVVKSLIQCCVKMHVNVAMSFSRLLDSTSVTELVIIHCFLNSPSF